MTHPTDQEVLNAILRQDFPSFVRKVFHTLCPGQTFVPEWYIRAITYQLERVRRGEITRLIINLPPRSLKSIITSVAYPAFVLGHDPTRRIVCVSYSNELSYKHSNDFRALISTPWYLQIFLGTRVGRFKDSEGEIALTRRGFRLATSVTGTLTGRGGDIIIIDDPLKGADAYSDTTRDKVNNWLINTAMSRHDDKRTGAIVIVMQRIHLHDLTGFVLGLSDDWTVLSLPAIAEQHEDVPLSATESHHRNPGDVLSPLREPIEVLESLRRQIGSDIFAAQYQQSTIPPGGAMIKRQWVQRYIKLPASLEGTFILQSWDTAAKGGPDNDWSVCSTWRRTNDSCWYLLDIWRQRVDYPSLKAHVEKHARLWNADQVLVEESGTAIALLQELRHRVPGLTGIKPDRDKETRMSAASARFEAGQIFFPERAPWLPELEAELFSFPGSRHDDHVDSISQALNHGKDLSVWVRLGEQRIPLIGPYPLDSRPGQSA
jgi:predicted phage terminase large subunit-like protein